MLHQSRNYQNVSFRLFLKVQIIPFVFPVLAFQNNPFYVQKVNVATQYMQNSVFSHVSKIKHCTIQEYYVIKTGNRLFSSYMTRKQTETEVYRDLFLTKTYSNSTSLFAVI